MNLAIDIGNTLSKAALIDAGQVVDLFKEPAFTPAYFARIFKRYPSIDRAILTSTRGAEPELTAWLTPRLKQFVRFDHTTPVPIKNGYKTPATLGLDRLAAAVAAAALYPGERSLVVDFGTAITIDLVGADGTFLGGNISPGASMRFRALHDYTEKLPLGHLTDPVELLGTTTAGAIESGVVQGITCEIEGTIARLSEKTTRPRIIFTGGDGNFFAKRFNFPIFASSDLVLYGLNRVLEYNRAE